MLKHIKGVKLNIISREVFLLVFGAIFFLIFVYLFNSISGQNMTVSLMSSNLTFWFLFVTPYIGLQLYRLANWSMESAKSKALLKKIMGAAQQYSGLNTEYITDTLPKFMFIMSLCILLFSIGMFFGINRMFPYSLVVNALDSTKLVLNDAEMIIGHRPIEHLLTSKNSGSGVVKQIPEKMYSGLTLIGSFYDGGLEVRLLKADGSVVNQWPISYEILWKGNDEFVAATDRPRFDWNSMLNGIIALPDGSVVLAYFGLVKLDRCGTEIWKKPYYVHHSIESRAEGGFWVPGQRAITEYSKHSPLKTPYKLDTIIQTSSDGDMIREIPILDIFWKNKMLPVLFANNRQFELNDARDIVHINDVEEIPPAYLSQFPQFSKGDVLISLRELSMLMVLDPVNTKVKWHKIGPWIQQHDADWQADGTITVFDNNYDANHGAVFGGSHIIAINPSSNESRIIYGEEQDQYFYSTTQGDHQVLGNGNILITESNAGRVIEVSETGEIVWEYINRYSEEKVVRIPDAIRYSTDYFNVTDWSCDS